MRQALVAGPQRVDRATRHPRRRPGGGRARADRARPALRAELTVDHGERLHRRYLSIPYASVQYEVEPDGLHRLTPFATADLLAR